MAFVDTYAFEESTASGPAAEMVDTGKSLAAFVGLFPPGKQYGRTTERSPNLVGLAHGMSLEGERVCNRVDALLAARDPREAYAFLDEYESMLGLPDAASVAVTRAERLLACYERLIARGDMSPDNLIAIGANLGYTIQVQFGMWNVWEVGGTCEVGTTGCQVGEPWDELLIYVTGGSNNAQLEASILRMCPAHMLVTFIYT